MDDLISRKALLKSLRSLKAAQGDATNDLDRMYQRAIVLAIVKTKLLPAVDAEPVRHGKWIKSDYPQRDDDSLYVYYNYHCSECAEMPNDRRWLPKYCPNCGARLEGGEI